MYARFPRGYGRNPGSTEEGRCYDLEPVPGESNQFIAYVAYPIDLFEEGSVTNLLTVWI